MDGGESPVVSLFLLQLLSLPLHWPLHWPPHCQRHRRPPTRC
jgi:hypothetical protein